MNKVANLALMLCLVTGAFSARGASQDSASQHAVAFRLIEDAVAKGEIPGAVALVAHRWKIVRQAACGLSDIENRVLFRTDTVCWIASVTKPVTTAAVMKLVEAGKLRLDDPIEQYIPEFRQQQDEQGRHHAITIRQLLSHTAGLPGDPPTRKDVFDPEWRGKSVAETVGPIAQARLQFTPGAKVQYSNAGFYVLGRIIEIVSGRPYAVYVKETILDPLGMSESFYPRSLASLEPQRIASVYRQRKGERFLYFRYEPGMTTRNDTPDGGLFCTAQDIFRFCRMFIDNDGRVLSNDSVEQMLREQAPGRGLGWARENGGFAHAGSSGAYAWGDPNTGLVAVLLIQYNDFRRVPRLHDEFIQAVRAAGTAESGPAGFSLYAPEDGGTPRESGRIASVGPGEFRIRARAEEGADVLTHAVSRADLVCRNDGAKPETVTLHLDLSGDGRRTNADNNAFGGMSTRDFVFIQPPGRPWQQVNGHVEGWVCTVHFTAPPGETRVGLSPWYTYADYLRFIGALPDHRHLKKTLLGMSDGGREQWELAITDPNISAESKRTIFWHAREHAYETFSSYAMEGLVAYLLSDAAADARRRYQFVLHPMTNVDGVAQGYEYRGGYDHPKPRGTATARLTFDAIDRLRPHFAVAWHNWIAPRDVDCLFYTDSENGRASRRAWDLFTQQFPSPRAVDHRWESEANPLAKNWFGRTLREDNVHQYAMKRYGTQVWGWEMPWWGRDEHDARKAGADFGRAFVATLDAIETGSTPDVTEGPPVTVPRWQVHEFELHGRSHVSNPFRDAALVGEFTSSSGKKIVVEGFHDGADSWKLRFTPDEEGEWRYLLRGEGVELSARGRLRCTPSQNHGFIRVHPENPYAFAYADGTPFFPMGDTCYGLYSDSPITPALRTEYLKTRRAQRFNFVRMGVLHSIEHWKSDPQFWPWGGTPDRPDLDRFNPDFFRGLDAVLTEMQAVGMNAELITLNFYQRPFTDTKLWTPERERQWLRYLVARYAALPNLFLWTLANEYETHPEGRYRLDVPDDPEWAKATARFIKQHDPYRHLVTVHPVVSSVPARESKITPHGVTTNGRTPRDPHDPPWRIGEFFGRDDAVDVLSQQTGQSGDGIVWNDELQCWTGDAPDLVASLRADRRYGRPVLNTESGYEYLRGHPTERKQVHHTDKVRRSAWRIACAGGYFAAGFHGTIGHSDAWNRLDAPNRYTFVVKDEGAAGQLALLYDFFASLPFWRMEPFAGVTGEAAVALADPGRVYVIYLPQGGEATVDLSSASGRFTSRWLDPRTGAVTHERAVTGGARRSFKAPGGGDWVLHLDMMPAQGAK